jgi:glycine cleavage system H protein
MADVKGYNMPDELYYHKDHAWARVDGNKVIVGMNDFFQKEAGDIVFIDLPEEEDDVSQGEVCGKIQSRKWIGKLVAPVSGEILKVNEEPYGEGWILEIEATDIENELNNLMQGEALTEFIEAEYRRAEEERAKE